MFEPLICIVTSSQEDLWPDLVKEMKPHTPKDISASFGENTTTTLQFNPKYEHKINPKTLDQICYAPHLILYLFTCRDKSEFQAKEKQQIHNFIKTNSRPFVQVLPVFINDPRFSGKKNFFNSVYTTIQQEFPFVSLLTVKSKNHLFSKSDIQKLWPTLVTNIIKIVTYRIETLKNLIKKRFVNNDYEVFRQVIRLSIVYEQVSLHQKAINVINDSKQLMTKATNAFKSFISEKSLEHSLDFGQPYDKLELYYMLNEPTEYDMQFLLLKHLVYNLKRSDNQTEAIDATWKFVQEVHTKVLESKEIPHFEAEFWLGQCLLDLKAICFKEYETGNKDISQTFSATLQWYVQNLPNLRKAYNENQQIISAGVEDPLAKNETKTMHSWIELFSIVGTQEKYTSEIEKAMVALFNINYSLGYKRTAAIFICKLLKMISDTRNKESNLASLITLAQQGGSHMIPSLTDEMLELMPYEEMIRSIGSILANNSNTYKELAAKMMTKALLNPNAPDLHATVILPLYYTIVDQTAKYVQGSESSVELECHNNCGADFECKNITVGFQRHQATSYGLLGLKGEHTVLKTGNKYIVKGVFTEPGTYRPIFMKMYSGGTVILCHFPELQQFIHVKPMPLPYDFKIELPDFLLPRRWQLALIRLMVNRPIEHLEFKVGGLSYKPAPLRQQHNSIEAENGMCYSNVPEGLHFLYLPIKPEISGILTIDACSDNKIVEHRDHFNVSEFLELKLIYRQSTKIAQLTSIAKSNCDITVTKVKFFASGDEEIESQALGIPFEVELTQISALFILETEPEVANVYLQQKGMQPFSLRLNVELFDEESVNPSMLQVQYPMTPMVSLNFNL